MDDPQKQSSQSTEIKNVLPDVVHSQQIAAVGAVEGAVTQIDNGHNIENESQNQDVQETSETESISEHIPSKVDSLSVTDNANHTQSEDLLKVEGHQEKVSKSNSPNIPFTYSPFSEHPSSPDPSKQSTSWPIDVNAVSDIHHISEESPVNLALSSEDFSKDGETNEGKSQSLPHTPSANDHGKTPQESPRSDNFVDSLNEESVLKSLESENEKSLEKSSMSRNQDSLEKDSTGSEEIIKLDIRGQGVPKFPLPTAKIIFGPPPEGSTVIDSNIEQIPVFPNLLSPFLVGAGDGMKVEEVFDFGEQEPKDISLDKLLELSPDKSLEVSPDKSMELSLDKQSFSSDKSEQKDLLVEELTVDDVKEREDEKLDEPSLGTQPKSMPPEETMSFSTMTTDYKTICEEYHAKLVHFEAAITQRDELIEELTVSLQRSVRERDELRHENEHLSNEVLQLQHAVGEQSSSDHDTVKAQLSDFMKYQSMLKDDSTKFYSALMSGGSSIQSSNGEKDMDHEEITVNYSKSDLRSSGSSEEFQTGFENKLTTIISKFDEYIEENLRNKLRESIIQILCEEIGKMRIESDTEVKELETQMQQDKQTFTVETRRLRELLASVKAGNADIDELRAELSVKHEKEMENLRTYFEKKCSDMERSYSEEVWRGRACLSPGGSASSLEGSAAGDCLRRRTRSAELPSLTLESTPLEQAVKQTSKKYEQQLEELRAEHLAYISDLQARHAETVASLEEQVTQLKAHIQTSENTEANVSVYQQDIDLELEKKRFEARVEQVRQDVVQQLQEQIQVLLSDPDAEVSSWPLELVALRDKIHGDARLNQEKELSSLRDELSGGEDKWKQRRNVSFDQNRHLEEVTRERDGLKRVAVSLHRVVGQLVAYCASAEDELNRTVLSHLLARVLPDADETIAEEESRPSTPNLSTELNTSLVSRGKHVHFAPDLHSILSELDEESVGGFLQQQRDVSADTKRELESSLQRLRQEAHELLELSARLTHKERNESKMLESGQVQITELVQDLDTNQNSCDNCELHRKNMEEAMAECLQRENLLRSDLEGAMIKIAHLMTSNERHSSDLIAEGYGTGQQLQAALSSARMSPRPRSCHTPGTMSLDGCSSPRAHVSRLAQDLEMLHKERDDLQQQLEAANRQLRSTRQFVEEQASEREAERDEFAKRLADLRDENARLATRLQNNARILNEMHRLRLSQCACRSQDAQVEQLEAQTREMNQIINELETRKAASDEELKATEEKIILLRDIIANLESQLEQKTTHETEILDELDTMKKTIEERDSKMRSLLGELESLRSEKLEQTDVTCFKCGSEEDKYSELMDKVKEQCRWLEERIHRRTARLERIHEVCSTSCSEPSEDVSLRDQRDVEVKSPESPPTPRNENLVELLGIWESLEAHSRAEDAALKRVRDLEMQRAQLKDVAQEVRAERDVLQVRMSEQALKISSLSARLQQQRNDAEALAHHASSQLSVQLHDARAEVQKLKEDLESKDKQLHRLKQNLEEKDKLNEQHQSLYGNSCNPKDKVVILERELSSAQTRIAQLEAIARGLEADKDELNSALRDHQRALAEKEEQLQELLALKLDDDNQREKSEDGGKASARTLSDIVSISEFDEQDLQMRRAELKGHNTSLTGAPHASDSRDKMLNRTLPPELTRPNMSSLNIEYIDSLDAPHGTPRADSLPAHLTSTQNKDRYKRNVNETMMFGTLDKFGESVKHSTAQNIPDNCSMYPNRDVSESKDHSVEPKKINFSVEPSHDNRTHDEEEFTSLRELGISLDIRQENFPDILTQLKHEIKKSRAELENCKSELKNAEEQLCEFPALKEEVEELKGLLENTMATMETDKKFYENQLENFSSNKKLLEQRLTELTQEVGEKSKDLHLLKEDILRRENMILELAKEKRNLTNKMTELEVKIDELQSRNNALEKCETENHQLREKLQEMQKLEQLVSEKNHQIDSLNQHLDRLDDLQRCLNDKTEELENLKEALEEKSSEVFQMQDTVEALNRDIAKLNEHNNQLNDSNKELKLKLSKLEKEQENASLKLQSSESELERANSLNSELTSKIDELKLLTDKLKDKETEIEILHEDINAFHEEIASLKEQMKMVSRSPSPRSKNGDDKKVADRQASNDKKQLVKIRKQISLLQHELDFNKKELNDKAFELAKAKLDVTELRNNLGQAASAAADRELATARLQHDLQALAAEKEQLAEQLTNVSARIREESNTSELKAKLREKTERCQELENELQDMKELVDRLREAEANEALQQHSSRALVVSGSRSPTAELERALRDQLNYSHSLDDDICEQILSASSDDREDIPRLALNISKSSSSIHSSSSERLHRLRADNDKLQVQVNNLELRLRDKDALITELNSLQHSSERLHRLRTDNKLQMQVNNLELRLRDKDALIAELNSLQHSSERLHRLRADNDKLQMQVNNLELRLRDKDALITELNR
ncbi:227 kDa spindle- and centromere-associated protein-like [Ostrinia furnacalis]|uniref:227 kDa spindle- and centromere-associated protein-like n=1 Tax=Ostrinia furnacalis TaxID=93504 RepID=UPI00103C4847|nr:227 kDa spindle- and centromere-associated protein-like [Ostrinia furnacalis]